MFTGAFLPTSNGMWCHVVCALYVPELFLNELSRQQLDEAREVARESANHIEADIVPQFVEGVERALAARASLRCEICHKKGTCVKLKVSRLQ